MSKRWTSYHGADGECTYIDQWCRSTGSIELGHPHVFLIQEIKFGAGQATEDRILKLLALTLSEFNDAVVKVVVHKDTFSLLESLQAKGKLRFIHLKGTYTNHLQILEVSLPAPAAEVKFGKLKRWWQFW